MNSPIRKKLNVMIEENGVNQENRDITIKDLHERIILMRKNWYALKKQI